MQPPKFNYQNNFNWNDVALFNIVETSEIDNLLHKVAKKYKKGHKFIDHNNASIYFVVDGQVKIGRDNNDGEITSFFLLQAGDAFGLEKLIEPKTETTYAETLMESTIAIIPMSAVNELMKSNAVFNQYIFQRLFAKVQRLEHHFERLLNLTSRQRIIRFLLDQVEKRGQRIGYEHVVWSFYIHRDIAELTKTSRQTVTTTLNDLKRKNIIDFNRRRLLIRDLMSLKRESLIVK
ncbi:MAG: Crp/Fnr family transcriptional regulator [Bacteroidota bacterium]